MKLHGRWIARFALLLLIGLLGSYHAVAQVNSAAIHGTVTDQSGAVIPNATITVLNTSTGITTTATANSKGSFALTSLQPGGPYTVTISASGFGSYQANNLTLNVNDDREVTGKLQIGPTAQTV